MGYNDGVYERTVNPRMCRADGYGVRERMILFGESPRVQGRLLMTIVDSVRQW